MTSNPLFVPPAAESLPPGALDSATEGADRLDAMALTPYGRNLLAHALVQLARDGWLRPEPGEGFEPVRDRETPEPETAPPARADATLCDRIADTVRAMADEHPTNAAWVQDCHTIADRLQDAASAVFPAPPSRAASLSVAERQFLTFALDLAADEMASHGDEFGAEDDAALESLRRLAAEAQQQEPESGDEALRAKVDEATATLRRIRSTIRTLKDQGATGYAYHQAITDDLAGPRPDRDEADDPSRMAAEAQQPCPTPCDPDCDAACHEVHQPPRKRDHQPNDHAVEAQQQPETEAGPWVVHKICCGHDDGKAEFTTWEAADSFREVYIDSARIADHERSAIIRRNDAPAPVEPAAADSEETRS